MKKPIVIALVVVVAIVGIMLIKNPLHLNMSVGRETNAGAISFSNDSADDMSIEYKLGDKKVNMQIPAGETITFAGEGFIRVFTSEKSGSYEIKYPNDAKNRSIKLSQVVEVAKKDAMNNEVYTKKGMLGDMQVTYEEIQQVGSY